MGRERAARGTTRGGDGIQAPRPARVALALGAAAAYGAVGADVVVRAGSVRLAFVPGVAVGGTFLALALVYATPTLGVALWLAGGSYLAYVAGIHHRLDGGASLVAVLLLLCGELTAWSLDERWRMRADRRLAWRRAGAVLLLGLGGLAAATLVVVLAAVPPSHGFLLTLMGAVAAVGAAGTGILLSRR